MALLLGDCESLEAEGARPCPASGGHPQFKEASGRLLGQKQAGRAPGCRPESRREKLGPCLEACTAGGGPGQGRAAFTPGEQQRRRQPLHQARLDLQPRNLQIQLKLCRDFIQLRDLRLLLGRQGLVTSSLCSLD